VNAIELAIAIAVKICFYPERLPDYLRAVRELEDRLHHSVADDRTEFSVRADP
jgi:hypothetical protein